MLSRRRGIATLALVVALAGAACGPRIGTSVRSSSAPAARSCGASALANQLVALVNQSRAAAGLRSLAWDGQLGCLAGEWSQTMASRGTLTHRDLNVILHSPAYSGYRTLGENILRGPSSMTAQQMHNAWMASPSHRANIMSPAYNRIGIGSATSGATLYATQNFGG